MVRFCKLAGPYTPGQAIVAFCLVFGFAAASVAQNSDNILGLPAVPQLPQTPASSTSPKPGKAAVQPDEAALKSALSGNIKLASSYQDNLITVRVATDKTYVGSALRAQALQAARLVQRDVRLSCGKLCKPAPMPAPTLLADNTLSFDLVISGYAGILSTADMVNLVSAKAIGKGAKPAAAPATAASYPASATSPENPAMAR